VGEGDNIFATWSVPTGHDTKDDWIGIYAVGTGHEYFLDLVYVETGTTSGTIKFQAPEPGTYEFRYFVDNESTPAATSNAFTVGNSDANHLLSSAVSSLSSTIVWTSLELATKSAWELSHR
jgi:hypothetical protein